MALKRKYRFATKSSKYVWAINIVDAIGALFCAAPERSVDAREIRSVCFVQLAHIGDFILLLPALYAFKKNTGKQVFVAVNSENKKLAESLPWIDKVFVIEHPSFERSSKSYLAAVKQVKQVHADLIFELRGDIRIIPLLKLFASCRILAGYDAGGCGYLLNKVLPYPFGRHITETYQGIFPLFGIGRIDVLKDWSPELLPGERTEVPEGSYTCINVGVGGRSKQWGREKFANLVRALSGATIVVLIGKIGQDDADYYSGDLGSIATVVNRINQTSFMASIDIVRHAALYVGLDTGFTHIATLLGRKVLAIYSATGNKDVWRPLELFPGQVRIINKEVPCGNCGNFECEDNICMQRITLQEVLQGINDLMPLPAGIVEMSAAFSAPKGSGQKDARPLQVHLITGSYPPMRCGVGDYTSRLAASLAGNGLSVTVLTSREAESSGAPVRVMPLVRKWGILKAFPLAWSVSRAKPDVVHFQYPTNGYGYKLGPQMLVLLLWLSGARIVSTIHEFRRVRFLRKLSLLPFLICSHAIIFMADEERVAIVKKLPWLKNKMASRTAVIPVNSNIPVLTPSLRPAEDGFVVAFFGLFYPAKLIESVIGAFQILDAKIHSRMTFRFIGDLHPHHQEYFASIKKLAEMQIPGERLEWVIGMPPEGVSKALGQSDVCVLPYPDGAHLRRTTLMAAMSHGVPVVTTRTAETPALFVDRENVLFASGPEHMADMVLEVMNNKELAATLAQKGREVSMLFSWDRIAEHHATVYNTVRHGGRFTIG